MTDRNDDLPSSDDMVQAARDDLTGDGSSPDTSIDEDASPVDAESADEHRPHEEQAAPLPVDAGSHEWSHAGPPGQPDLVAPPAEAKPWWNQPWVGVVTGLVVFGALMLWNSGVFDDPPEEQFLDGVEQGMREEAGISAGSWDCIEENLREGGYVDELAVELEDVDEETLEEWVQWDAALSDAPPGVARFMEGFLHFTFDPVEGCVSPQEMVAMQEAGLAAEDAPMALGSDANLDMLHTGCVAGSMADCDMLWLTSPADSEYEVVAETCGERNEPLDHFVDSCMAHHFDYSEMGDLEEQCLAGFFPACDQLYRVTPVGSPMEEVGATCGGRREANPTTPCFVLYGHGSRA